MHPEGHAPGPGLAGGQRECPLEQLDHEPEQQNRYGRQGYERMKKKMGTKTKTPARG